MDSKETTFEDLILSQVNSLTDDDSIYEFQANAFHSAKSLKELHRQQLISFFKLADIRENFEIAQNLILHELPYTISKEEYSKIKEEMDQSGEHFIQFLSTLEKDKKDLFLQEMFGLSNDTLLQIYKFAMNLMDNKRYQETLSLLIFLTTLTPFVSSFWVGEGLILQILNRQEEALAAFNCAKTLNPSNPAIYQFSIESCIQLNDMNRAKQEYEQLKVLINDFSIEEKKLWLEKMNPYSNL